MKEVFYPALQGKPPYTPELRTALAHLGSHIHGERQRPTAYRMGENSIDKTGDEGKVYIFIEQVPVNCWLAKSLNYAWALPCLILRNCIRGEKIERLAEKRAGGMCRGAVKPCDHKTSNNLQMRLYMWPEGPTVTGLKDGLYMAVNMAAPQYSQNNGGENPLKRVIGTVSLSPINECFNVACNNL